MAGRQIGVREGKNYLVTMLVLPKSFVTRNSKLLKVKYMSSEFRVRSIELEGGMKKRWLAVILIIGALFISVGVAGAQGRGNGKGKGKGNPHEAREDRDQGRGDDDRDERWERRGDYEYQMYERGGRPPGWVEGRKVGWGDCGLPPGQAKKYGCRSYVHEGRRYYYYRDEHDRIIVRRPVLHVHVDIVR